MQQLHVDHQPSGLSFTAASQLAIQAAKDHAIQSPAIIAWHQRGSHQISPRYDGGDAASWWHKYGAGNGGTLEVSVGNAFDFVMMETSGFETVDQLPIRNLRASDGQEYICLTPLLGDASTPIEKVCVPIDEWAANQY
jgi:hypothetical protein